MCHTRLIYIDNINNFGHHLEERQNTKASMIQTHGTFRDDVIKWKHFHVTDPLWGDSNGHRCIPFTKASDAGLWCFLYSAPEQTIETPVVWGAIALINT